MAPNSPKPLIPSIDKRASAAPLLWPELLLCALVLIVFFPVVGNGWVDRGDRVFFLRNPHFLGFGAPEKAWEWNTMRGGVYRPLGWIFASGEYAIVGLDPHGFHAVSLLLYIVNTLVLYRLALALLSRFDSEYRRLAESRSWLVAGPTAVAVAIFAVHPLRVECVAWATNQSLLCCAFFCLLATLWYLRAQEPQVPRSIEWLAVSFVAYIAAVLFDSAAVPLPLVFLILDVDPLGRLGGARGWFNRRGLRAWLEKAPFFLVGFLASAMAASASVQAEEFDRSPELGFMGRLCLAAYRAWFYVGKSLLPRGLSFYYPKPEPFRWEDPKILACLFGLVGVSFALGVQRERHRGLTAAWFVFLAMLTAGLWGNAAGDGMAMDRHSYIPSFGFAVFLAGASIPLWRYCLGKNGLARAMATALAVVSIFGLGFRSRSLIPAWNNPRTLWTSAYFSSGASDPRVRLGLVRALVEGGDVDGALFVLEPVVEKSHESVYYRLIRDGLQALSRDDSAAAIRCFERAIDARPDQIEARILTSRTLVSSGRFDEAVVAYNDWIRADPYDPSAVVGLGRSLLFAGRPIEAGEQLAQAASQAPYLAEAWVGLAQARAALGRVVHATELFKRAVALEPGNANVHADFGDFLMSIQEIPTARAQYDAALRIDPNNAAAKLGKQKSLATPSTQKPAGRADHPPGRTGEGI